MICRSPKVEVSLFNTTGSPLLPVFLPIMPQGNKHSRDRQILVTPEIQAALKARKSAEGLSEKHQVAAAIEGYLKREVNNADRALLISGGDKHRKLVPISDELWERLWKRKESHGLDLDEQIHIALTLYFADLNGVDPFTKEPKVRGGVAESLPITDPREAVREELRAQLGALGVRVASELVPASRRERGGVDPLLAAARIILSNAAMTEEETVTVLSLSAVPCGPWKTILNEAEPFELPRRLAKVLGAQEGDLLVPVEGQSMVEAGVPEGGEVIMRPLRGARPKLGQIVLCSIEREGDVWESTIKFWFETPRGAPLLKNGKSIDVPLPPDVVEVHPVAVLVGVMGRATYGTIKGPSTEAKQRRRKRNSEDPLSE